MCSKHQMARSIQASVEQNKLTNQGGYQSARCIVRCFSISRKCFVLEEVDTDRIGVPKQYKVFSDTSVFNLVKMRHPEYISFVSLCKYRNQRYLNFARLLTQLFFYFQPFSNIRKGVVTSKRYVTHVSWITLFGSKCYILRGGVEQTLFLA